MKLRQTLYALLFCATGLNAITIPSHIGSKTGTALKTIEQGLKEAQNIQQVDDLKAQFYALRHSAGLRFSCPHVVEEFEQLIADVARKFSYRLASMPSVPSIDYAAHLKKVTKLASSSAQTMRVAAQKAGEILPSSECVIGAGCQVANGTMHGAKKLYSVLPQAKTVGTVAGTAVGATALGAARFTKATGNFLYENSEEITDCTCNVIHAAGAAAKGLGYIATRPLVWMYMYRAPLMKALNSVGGGIKSFGQLSAQEIYALLYGRTGVVFEAPQKIKDVDTKIEHKETISVEKSAPSAPPMDEFIEDQKIEETQEIQADDEIHEPAESYPQICVVCEKNTEGSPYLNQLECVNCTEHFEVHLACGLHETPTLCEACKRNDSPVPSAPPLEDEQVTYPDLYEKKNC